MLGFNYMGKDEHKNLVEVLDNKKEIEIENITKIIIEKINNKEQRLCEIEIRYSDIADFSPPDQKSNSNESTVFPLDESAESLSEQLTEIEEEFNIDIEVRDSK